MKARRIGILLVCSLLACGDEPGTGPSDDQPGLFGLTAEQHERVAGRLAVIAAGIAASGEGAGFFDNFLPCVRRGVIDYRNSDSGRLVEFSGCDLGGEVVVDGSGELSWAPVPGPRRERFCGFDTCAERLEWRGELQIVVDGDVRSSLSDFTVAGIAMATVYQPAILAGEFSLGGAEVLIDEVTTPLDDASLAGDVFAAGGLNPRAIPNPGGSVAALTSADLKRLFYEFGTGLLASFMFNEALETQRGDHLHDLNCGTSAVTVLPSNLPHIENDWSGCELIPGIFVTGRFTLDWSDFNLSGAGFGRLSIRLSGSTELGGALPTVALTGMTWTLEPVQSGRFDLVRMTGAITGAGGSRTFAVVFVLDD